MFHRFRNIALAGAFTAIVLLLSTTAAFAQRTVTVQGGRTNVKLASSFVAALSSLGVTPGTVSPTELEYGVVNFPITGGAIDLDTAKAQIVHSGGLTLTAGATQVRLQSFIIDTTGAAPVLTGLVVVDNKLLGRLPLFHLALPAGITLPLKPMYGILNLNGVGVSLTATAATALNGVFHVSALQDPFAVGTANVAAILTNQNEENQDGD